MTELVDFESVLDRVIERYERVSPAGDGGAVKTTLSPEQGRMLFTGMDVDARVLYRHLNDLARLVEGALDDAAPREVLTGCYVGGFLIGYELARAQMEA